MNGTALKYHLAVNQKEPIVFPQRQWIDIISSNTSLGHSETARALDTPVWGSLYAFGIKRHLLETAGIDLPMNPLPGPRQLKQAFLKNKRQCAYLTGRLRKFLSEPKQRTPPAEVIIDTPEPTDSGLEPHQLRTPEGEVYSRYLRATFQWKTVTLETTVRKRTNTYRIDHTIDMQNFPGIGADTSSEALKAIARSAMSCEHLVNHGRMTNETFSTLQYENIPPSSVAGIAYQRHLYPPERHACITAWRPTRNLPSRDWHIDDPWADRIPNNEDAIIRDGNGNPILTTEARILEPHENIPF